MNIQEILTQPGVSIVDVREPFEFEMGHIEGAKNIPLSTIPGRMEEFKSLAKPMILYCMSGNRSGQAVQYLEAQGCTNLHNGGGISSLGWMIDNLYVGKE